jgi:hypothetical protein
VHRRRDFRRNPVAMDIPPWARVPEEALLLLQVEALPETVTVRAQAVDRRAPAVRRASPPKPAPNCADAAVGHVVRFDRRGVIIAMTAGDLPAPR